MKVVFFFNWSIFAIKVLPTGSEELAGETDYSRPPFDGELASITLWPETDKIFGHGYEVNSRILLPFLIEHFL